MNKFLEFVFTCFILNFLQQISTQKIAIIGSGISGSAATLYLQKLFRYSEITVFEASNYLGGRIKQFDNDTEIGASFIIEQNHNMISLIEELGLQLQPSSVEDQSNGIFDGKNIVFTSKQNFILKISSLLWRYKLGPTYLKNIISKFVNQFSNIYKRVYIGEQNPFTSVEKLLNFLELKQYLYQDFQQFCQENQINSLFVEEFVHSFINSLYNQDLSINTTAGLVAMAGAFNKSYNVKNGISQIMSKIFQHRDKRRVNYKLNTRVTMIKNKKNSIIVEYENDNKIIGEQFDIVIITFPLQAKYKPNDFLYGFNQIIKQQFVVTYVSIIQSSGLKNSYFNVNDESDIPDIILTNQNKIFTDILLMKENQNGQHIYKIQSQRELNNNDYNQIFKDWTLLHLQKWQNAYPKFKKIDENEKLNDFRLGKGVYFVNAMEQAFSCMETQLISTINIINLILQNEQKEYNWEIDELFLKEKFLKQQKFTEEL